MNWKPNTKIVAAGGLGVPLSIILQWVLLQFGIEMPSEVAVAVGGLVSTGVGYLTPEKRA